MPEFHPVPPLGSHEFLIQQRKSLGLSQRDLAALARVNHSIVADIEAGRRVFKKEKQLLLWTAIANVIEERRKTPRIEGLTEELWAMIRTDIPAGRIVGMRLNGEMVYA